MGTTTQHPTPPRVLPHVIERPRLTRLLDQAESPIITLVAPAGYGKTTLAKQWLKPKPHVWYRATSASRDVAALAVGLADAASTFVPRVTRRIRDQLARTAEPQARADAIASTFAAELSEWPPEAWLAVDDYHLAMSSQAGSVFFERIVASAQIRLFVTSRIRPDWASARRLLYGEIYELGQPSLAMTEEEANQVLANRFGKSTGGLVALAQGWPAVIGLAAFSQGPALAEETFPETLYEYFAEELYLKSEPTLREWLSAIAIIPALSQQAIEAAYGASRASEVTTEALRLGFLTSTDSPTFELHPLVRSFLLSKFNDLHHDLRMPLVRRVFDFCIDRAQWDDAYGVVEGTQSADLIPVLISASLREVIGAGRVATLEQWLRYARDAHVDSPVLALAEAELAFRRGSHRKAETLATQAAMSMTPRHASYAIANLRAGQAAYFNDRHSVALDHFSLARAHARDPATNREAIWGSFVTAVDLEEETAVDFLTAYEHLPEQRPDDVVRVATGRFSVGYRHGPLVDALLEAQSILDLVDDANDPMIRSAFWNAYAWALTLNARYAEAIEAAEREMNEARNHGLDFVIPHALLATAHARLGRRERLEASRVLDEIEALAQERHNEFLTVNVCTLRARMHLLHGRAGDALAITAGLDRHPQNRATRGEHLAIRALALLIQGRKDESLELVQRAESVTRGLHLRTIALLVRAIIERDNDDNNDAPFMRVLAQVAETGQLDALVLAYRARPDVLSLIANSELGSELAGLLARARDHALARRVGIVIEPTDGPVAPLSPREREVSGLLAQGKTNAEIARILFISEVTAKVHVRRILQKLGVRNRSEAAVRLATQLPDEEQD